MKISLLLHLSDNLVEFIILTQKPFIAQNFEVFSRCFLASSIVFQKPVAIFIFNTLDSGLIFNVSLWKNLWSFKAPWPPLMWLIFYLLRRKSERISYISVWETYFLDNSWIILFLG